VPAVQDVVAAMDSLEQGELVEGVGRDRVLRLSRELVELVQAIVHPSVLDSEHSVAGLVAPERCPSVDPVAEPRGAGQGPV
jgi:hypothetical protein